MTIEEKSRRDELLLFLAVLVAAMLALAIYEGTREDVERSGPFWRPQDWEREHGSLCGIEEREEAAQ